MNKLIAAYILGILSFVLALTGVFSLLLSIPGLLLSIAALKMPEKKIAIPLGYEGFLGKKRLSARPFVTSRYLAYIAVVLNGFSIAVSLFATFSILALFTAGMR
ncbi:MAG: hypothetical protein UV61_C0002G0060 [Candidatus Gottesmanbacteria bacterium GW2011_GWB1_43_11]|uniref:Uncharacterized protein n=1 Tax=Candidatus Gottesmanbacteria bacterium GW2011_GWB1_43_11 TaxID=1618446 RepID=A0A0G1CP59_9BACT|nr:MAG: hypothetical protein UV04_C0020G0013 [Candidatus Gottesmanbacteria bacterium GW2011_GWA2_42_16]KKS81854.1 MAG: hypothetical protein UV55_C0008G0069 [Candidatus Gottesmanbacteria bacterium GW2011_GWC1_43_10]KKS87339.1 MAG: hypothetical protein UV61_C0002G0060 [Candidatus Gottesmanbacteria bacterium GW2011_GWB1_43_11]HCM37510.1 hypothetical protein [Patescibacteria group bacterium]